MPCNWWMDAIQSSWAFDTNVTFKSQEPIDEFDVRVEFIKHDKSKHIFP